MNKSCHSPSHPNQLINNQLASPTGVTDRGFTGHKENRGIGLTYMNARYYASSIGRFASSDTIIPDPGSSQAYNRYAYSYNNPIRFTDPSGHFSEDAISEYIQNEYCSSKWSVWDCENIMLDSWKSNKEWWNMLLNAEAGDTLVGTMFGKGVGTSSANTFGFKFLGDGQDKLIGIEYFNVGDLSQEQHDAIFPDSLSLGSILSGRIYNKNSETRTAGDYIYFTWAGFIRWSPDSTRIHNLYARKNRLIQTTTPDHIRKWTSAAFSLGFAGLGALIPISKAGTFGYYLQGGSAAVSSLGSTYISDGWIDINNMKENDVKVHMFTLILTIDKNSEQDIIRRANHQ